MLIGALDIGGSKTIAAIAELNTPVFPKAGLMSDYKILESRTFETITSGGFADKHMKLCSDVLLELISEKGYNYEQLRGVGISAPGMVDAFSENLIFAPGTGWKNVNLNSFLRKYLNDSGLMNDIVIHTDNDVNVCARAEAAESGKDNLFWITVSNGIGGALISDGKILGGAHSVAGEIGHCKVEYENPRKCPCGQYGCAEAHCSGKAAGKMAVEKAEKSASFKEKFKGEKIDASSCAALAARGDKEALEIFATVGDYLGRAIAQAINLTDPAAVYIGGGMAKSFDLLYPHIMDRIKKSAVSIGFEIPVLPSAIGYTASLTGAFKLAME